MTATDTTRTGLIETAMTYLDALVSDDAASASRWARSTRSDGSSTATPPRWVYDLDADLTRATQSATFGPREEWIPSFIAERFTIADGLITEIEVVYAGSEPERARPPRPERYPRIVRSDAPARQALPGARGPDRRDRSGRARHRSLRTGSEYRVPYSTDGGSSPSVA
jgi:hypothetical protein